MTEGYVARFRHAVLTDVIFANLVPMMVMAITIQIIVDCSDTALAIWRLFLLLAILLLQLSLSALIPRLGPAVPFLF